MRAILTFSFILFSVVVFGQPIKDQKRDRKWAIGNSSDGHNQYDFYGNMILDFGSDSVSSRFQFMPIPFAETNASICDTVGNLLFYTNGILICDSVNQIMYGSDTLNQGPQANNWAYLGSRTSQGALALPQPGNDTTYYIIHTRYDYDLGLNEWPGQDLLYTKVNIVGAFGFEIVSEMNVHILSDTLDWGRITACRHANGRDWWVLVPYFHSDKYHRLLLDSMGLHNLGVQQIGLSHTPLVGQTHFTANGDLYVTYGSYYIAGPQEVLVYDFDRCSGTLNNYRHAFSQDTAYCIGAAISPNSRYLYGTTHRKIYQFDLESNDIGGSRVEIATWDGFMDTLVVGGAGYPTYFYMAQLAYDGKIYISSNNGTRYYHVIENPDEPGLACDLRQHALRLPCFNFASVPNYPNFRLGTLDGSPCDTLGIDSFPVSTGPSPLPQALDIEKGALDIYPNPASDLVNVGFGAPLPKGGVLSAFDVNGRLVWERHLSVVSVGCTLNVGDWASGTYFLVMRGGAGEKANGILMKN